MAATLPEFRLEVYLGRWEFAARHHLAASDAQTLTVEELLALGTDEQHDGFARLPLGYTPTWGTPPLLEAIAATYDTLGPEHVLAFVPLHEVLAGMTGLNAERREDRPAEALGGAAITCAQGDVVEHGPIMPGGRERAAEQEALEPPDKLTRAMTAKEKLRQAVEELTELEAEQTLAFIAGRRGQDPVLELFRNAPEADEPLTPEEQASLEEAWAQRGDSVSLAELRRELD